MLVQFSVENFLSFDHRVVFSMTASSDTSHPSHLINVEGFRRSPLLRGAALYGANGAGKSNLLKAVAFARNLIVEGTRPERLIPVIPFRLREGERPSRFQFHFIVNDRLYDYGFVIDNRKVNEEWLYATALEKGAREYKLFERTAMDNETHINFGGALTGKRQLRFVGQGTRPNQLFLTEAIERNIVEIEPVWLWFKETLMVLTADAESEGLPILAHLEQGVIEFITEFMKVADITIRKIDTEQHPVDFDRDFPAMAKAERESIKEKCQTVIGEAIFSIQTLTGTRYLYCRSDEAPMLIRFLMYRQSTGGKDVPFEFEEESEGTQRLMHLLPRLGLLQSEEPQVIMLDELERRLHTHLSRRFIQATFDTPRAETQFIFTTHDTNLLDLELLRRDEIWFVEKDKSGASNPYSLAEFKVRPDLQIEKGYLNGRFGAIPFFGDLSRIGLEGGKGFVRRRPLSCLFNAENCLTAKSMSETPACL